MYGKQIISNEGKRIGTVEDLIIDFVKWLKANSKPAKESNK